MQILNQTGSVRTTFPDLVFDRVKKIGAAFSGQHKQILDQHRVRENDTFCQVTASDAYLVSGRVRRIGPAPPCQTKWLA